MKQIRVFSSEEIRDAVLDAADYSILYMTEGAGVGLKAVASGPDYSEPFYINIRKTVTLSAVEGLQMSTDKKNWSDTVAGDLPIGKTYFRVASDQLDSLKPKWTENDNSDYDVGGNINSLVKVNFENDVACYNFKEAFMNKYKLKNAGKLILPATTLVSNCYAHLFNGCTLLITAPELPATALAQSCYVHMFYNCASLARTPELPATALAQSCYAFMFAGCASLTQAPELPAITSTYMCYYNMFGGCPNINYIKCLATDISATNCLYNWTSGVSPTGTFVKASGVTYPTGKDGIPKNWTVEEI